MNVKRIVTNIRASNPKEADKFYKEIFGLDLMMDFGWIRTYGAAVEMNVQLNIAAEGGSGTPVPDISIEVDDLDAVLAKVKQANIPIEYGPVEEPWVVRRFYIRDPFGKLLNVLQHL